VRSFCQCVGGRELNVARAADASDADAVLVIIDQLQLRPMIADIIGGKHITPIDDQLVRMNLDRAFDRKSAPYDESDRDHEQRRGEQRLQERQLAAEKEPPTNRSACHAQVNTAWRSGTDAGLYQYS
jgi:hypothetical protein